MAYEFKIKKRVEFSETDMAGIVHFSNFFRYMEVAEHAFYRSLGFSVSPGKEEIAFFGFPRVHAKCDYRKPARFEDELEIHLLISRIKSKAIELQFRFRNLSATKPDEEIARGSLTIVCVTHETDGAMKATVIPDLIRKKIHEAPKSLLAD